VAEAEADNAFQILIATLLSARTQDATTAAASARLFARARTPRAMAALPVREIEKLIYPVSFYRNKAEHVKACCEMLLTRFGGRVPDYARRTGAAARGRQAITSCSSWHSRAGEHLRRHARAPDIEPSGLGMTTRTPEETEQALYRAADRRWWSTINLYLVTWGQNMVCPSGPSTLRRLRRRGGLIPSGVGVRTRPSGRADKRRAVAREGGCDETGTVDGGGGGAGGGARERVGLAGRPRQARYAGPLPPAAQRPPGRATGAATAEQKRSPGAGR
jgi:endonuclease-3